MSRIQLPGRQGHLFLVEILLRQSMRPQPDTLETRRRRRMEQGSDTSVCLDVAGCAEGNPRVKAGAADPRVHVGRAISRQQDDVRINGDRVGERRIGKSARNR